MSKIDITEFRNIALFTGLDPVNLQEVASIAYKKDFERHQTIFSEGDVVDGFHIILSGKVKIFKLSSEGKEQILHIFGPGEPIGEVPVFEGSRFPAFAEAIKLTGTMFFPKDKFLGLLKKNPSIAIQMLAILSKRLHHFTLLIDDISLKEVPARLARYLLHLSTLNDDTESVILDISKTQLAALIGTIPETLSRAFRKMSQQNLISINGVNIKLIDRDKLETLSWSGKI